MNLLKLFPKNVHVLRWMHEGPLGPYMDSHAAYMHEQSYAKATVEGHLRLLADFSRWLARHRLTVQQITSELFPRYLRSRQSRHWRPSINDPSKLKVLLNHLIQQGVIPEPLRPSPTPAERLQDEFSSYLRQERGLAAKTIGYHLSFVSKFLAERFGTGPVDLSTLNGSDVIDFVRRRASWIKGEYAHAQTTALRAFLRFGRYRGDLHTDLAACVPSVANVPLRLSTNHLPLPHPLATSSFSAGRRVDPGNFTPSPSQKSGLEPLDSSRSCHPMRAAAFRRNRRAPPVASWPIMAPTWIAYPLRSTVVTPLHRYYEVARPSASHPYSRPRGSNHLWLLRLHRCPGSHVPYVRLC